MFCSVTWRLIIHSVDMSTYTDYRNIQKWVLAIWFSENVPYVVAKPSMFPSSSTALNIMPERTGNNRLCLTLAMQRRDGRFFYDPLSITENECWIFKLCENKTKQCFSYTYDMYLSPNIIKLIKSRRMRWEAQRRNAYRFLVRSLKGR